MCSDIVKQLFVLSIFLTVSCSSVKQLADVRRSGTDVDVSVPQVMPGRDNDEEKTDNGTETEEGPAIMNAVKDLETGEMVAVDVIRASRVVARFRNVAERAGKVTIGFDVSVPSSLVCSEWQLRLVPELELEADTMRLDPVLITGDKYRSRQIRGYERYRAFISSILTDSSDFVMMKPLEIFLQRNYPEIYGMKNDTSWVSDPQAESIFGVKQEEVLKHYTRYGLAERNRKKQEKSVTMLGKITGGLTGRIRLDTVLVSGDDVCYRYTQTLDSRPGLKKIHVSLSGGIYENGRLLYSIPGKSVVDFYISSLSSLADCSPHYKTVVVKRNVYDYTNAILDFDQSSSRLDTLSETNSSELVRIRKSMDKMLGMDGFVTDSVIVTASCSLEGAYSYNASLAERRAQTVVGLLSGKAGSDAGRIFKTSPVPENWKLFMAIVARDSTIAEESRRKILSLPYKEAPDSSESVLKTLPEYRYLREKVYPRLRIVRLDFYLHRKNMAKDVVCTEEIDSVYMNGVDALGRLDYARAVELLGGYRDYNSALAYLSSGYDGKALEVIRSMDMVTPRTLYVEAIALSRLGREQEASEIFDECVRQEPSLLHRGRLDPEIQKFTLKYDKF